MGVKSLTSFVEKNSNSLLKKYELHDTDLVIDGDSTAYELYQHLYPANYCFTGDYDRFGNSVTLFFDMLLKCNIKPIFIFDGGHENRKIETIIKIMKDGMKVAGTIDATSKKKLFPLFLGELFKDIAAEYKFPVIRCDYEAGLESANIARALNCPVLSNDSDFYIFDVQYIPLDFLEIKTIRKIFLNARAESYFYIPCNMFQKEKFLKILNITDYKLPLFATLLGKNCKNKKEIHKLIKKGKCKFNSTNKCYIEILASWLSQQHSIQTALVKIFGDRNNKQHTVLEKINETINGYICKNSKYLMYINSDSGFDKIDSEDLINSYSYLDKNFLNVFLNNSRKCFYPSCFINILLHNAYYITPQVEDPSLESSHAASLEIISIINQILKNSEEHLKVYTRIKNKFREQLVPIYSVSLPTYLEIQNMPLETRKKLFLNILHIKKRFIKDSLNYFPDSWHLYILSIKYLCDKSAMNWSLIQPILLCKLIIEYVDSKIGYFRNSKSFSEKYKMPLNEICTNKSKSNVNNKVKICTFKSITFQDSLITQQNLISYFEMNFDLEKGTEIFNRKIVHATSQFQSVFYHIGFLNKLIKNPFKMCPISNCFNGTFIYNLTSDLRNKNDENFIAHLLKNAPSVLGYYNHMIEILKKHIDVPFLPTNQGFNV